ncbi:MAG: replication restart helicase PriA [Moorellaceae bacterium]
MLATVLINSALQRILQPLVYEVPPDLAEEIRLGSRVIVPLGKKEVEGVVVDFPPEAPVQKIKPVLEVLDEELLPPSLIKLLLWVSEYYLCQPGETLPLVLPPRLKQRSYSWYWLGEKGWEPDAASFICPLSRELAAYLVKRGKISRRQLKKGWPQQEALAALKELEQRGLVEKRYQALGPEKKLLLSPEVGVEVTGETEVPGPGDAIILTEEQRRAVAGIEEALEKGQGSFLLYGITGSGKTEVYIHSIAAALRRNKGAIVLVPEHSLIPQMFERLCRAFGNLVVIIHGEMAAGERSVNWQKVRQGQAQVVVGTRSALFAPLPRLGLIIIDEEHAASYKHEAAPRYDAREVALQRGRLEGAVVILGSATPSTETFFLAGRGRLKLLALRRRVGGSSLPRIKIIDLREEYQSGNSGYLSRELQAEIKATLARGEQVLLFLNRRGYAPHVVCRSCGYVPTCSQCAVSLTYHADGKMRCHYCGQERKWQGTCPQCQGVLALLGVGTQRVEAEVRSLFPQARVLRADSDSTKTPRRWAEIYHQFASGQADILIGTQTIAKGMDFEGVTLVGVVNADLSLFLPDFRARERTFQLLMQVAGRAGRRAREGKVLIQTFNPQDPAIIFAAGQDYLGFYRAEISVRRALRYPPFVKLARVGLTGLYEGEVISAAYALSKALSETGAEVEVLGPAPASIARIKRHYRWQLTLKAAGWQPLQRALTQALEHYRCPPGVKIIREIGPVTMW